MPNDPTRAWLSRPLAAVVAGALIGTALLLFASREPGERADQRIELGINGVPTRLSRDLLLPPYGWTLQVAFVPPIDPAEAAPELVLEMREERTGMTIEIQEQLIPGPSFATLTIPESMGLREGLLAVRVRATYGDGAVAEDWRRLRIRPFPGGPPIGTRQIIHFDFSVDRDGDGRPDFEQDLEQLGLASPAHPAIAKALARRIAERALARVERAFDAEDDPNRTGGPRDPVAVRFQLDPVLLESERVFTTRICVGGRDASQPGSVGHVRFDPRNARRAGAECTGVEAAGLFPAELVAYRESALYREIMAPFDGAAGGAAFDGNPERQRAADHAVAVLGDALGSLMAHETGHALGLVPPGRPGVGLFGGDSGESHAHAVGPDDATAPEPSLMDPGRPLRFEQLAGVGDGGELRFRPLDYAYLRDRVVLAEEPRQGANPRD